MFYDKLKKYSSRMPCFFEKIKVINADLLRLIAVVCMVFDHLWGTIIPDNNWMNYFGRVAFPIFAFQIAEGFLHTGNLKKYFFRLIGFAILSEIPFNLICSGEVFYPDYQNVLFTFSLGIGALWAVEKIKKSPTPKTISASGILLIFMLVIACFLKVDYGVSGVLTVVVFYIFKDVPWGWILQLISLVFLNAFVFPGRPVLMKFCGEIISFPVQLFAVFSLVPIWLYNGKKGDYGKAFQYGFYLFYPLHLLVLFVLKKGFFS